MNHPKLQIITRERAYLPLLLIEDEGTYVKYTDKFGRSWKLQPVINENIQMPFIVTPLPKEG